MHVSGEAKCQGNFSDILSPEWPESRQSFRRALGMRGYYRSVNGSLKARTKVGVPGLPTKPRAGCTTDQQCFLGSDLENDYGSTLAQAYLMETCSFAHCRSEEFWK